MYSERDISMCLYLCVYIFISKIYNLVFAAYCDGFINYMMMMIIIIIIIKIIIRIRYAVIKLEQSILENNSYNNATY